MQLDIRTIYLMYAVLYLMLHGIIWFSLSRYHSRLVRRWSLAGIISASGIALFATVGVLPDWAVASLGQVLMAAGNFGRQYVLRSVDHAPPPRWVWRQGLFHLAYLGVNGSLFLWGASNARMMLVFFVFYALACLDFYFSGLQIGRQRVTSGARTLQLGGIVFSVSLGVKALTMLWGWGAQDFYDPGWDQVALFAAQILAISLLNFGFMQVLVDQFQQERWQVERDLLVQKELAAQSERQSAALAALLREREELLRQLTLSSKSAGMAALVSAIAHEINQPLTSIVLKSELIQVHAKEADDTQEIRQWCERIRLDTHRAATMIAKLRGLFNLQGGGARPLDFVEFLKDVVAIVEPQIRREKIQLSLDVPEVLPMTFDPHEMQQVVVNLLNNAMRAVIHHRPAHPRIDVCLQADHDGGLTLSVQDNGGGLAQDLHNDVFALVKSDAAREMGIGLWLSQKVVESLGGTLSFESSPGHGAVFRLHLPKRDNSPNG